VINDSLGGYPNYPSYLNYGLSRVDVCTALPGRASCPNVGWQGTLQITDVTNGLHTITFTAIASDGTHFTTTRQVNIANTLSDASDQLLVNTESPVAGSIISGTVPVSGWVVDGLTFSPELDIAVDGVSVATTFSGQYRTDVCLAYPWSQNCPYAGWQSNIDTTALSNGDHTLAVTAVAATGKRVTRVTPFVTNNSVGWSSNGQFLNVESPSAGQRISGTVLISGWAVSAASAISEVDIRVDGVPVGAADYGLIRQDVCNAYPKSLNCPYSGWYFTLDTRTLTDGMHMISAVEVTSVGSASVSQSFVVANGGIPSSIHAAIDAPSLNASVSGEYLVSGWAIDDRDSVARVSVEVDGLPQGFANYGGVRNDVCAAYPGRAGCPDVGWSLTLDTTPLQNGSHTLAVTFYSKAGDILTVSRAFSVSN
jgi:hypothetical protein